MDTDEVIGLIIMDYRKLNKDKITKHLSFKLDFEDINQNILY